MKKLIVLLAVAFASSRADAAIISATSEMISPASVDQIVSLVNDRVPGSSHKKLSVVVQDHGMSTDLSPRYTVLLGFASLAEMGNMSADFKLTDQAVEFVGAKMIGSSLVEVKFVEYRDDATTGEMGMYDIVLNVDISGLLNDEWNARAACGADFCDVELTSAVNTTEVATIQK